MKGTVKFYNESRGFGFITPEDGSKDIFVHATALGKNGLDALVEGDKVEFDTEPSKRNPEKGPTAVNVKVVQ